MRHTAASAVLVSGWHRLSYRTTEGLFQLEAHIRQLHRAVGIAVVDGKHLVFGTGSTQLMNGLVYALSPDADDASSPPASVVATAPYYLVRLLFFLSRCTPSALTYTPRNESEKLRNFLPFFARFGCVQPYKTQTAMFDGRKYKWETAMFDGRKYKWDGTTAPWVNATTQNSTKSSWS
jgi:hypothetical protein